MARGWESKAVEEQINAREDRAPDQKQTQPTKFEIEQRSKRESLMLARARTVSSLAAASDDRYRAQLKQALSHLDSRIAELKG